LTVFDGLWTFFGRSLGRLLGCIVDGLRNEGDNIVAATGKRRDAPDRPHLSLVSNGNTVSKRGSPADVGRALGGLSQSDRPVPIGRVSWSKVVALIGVLLLSLGLWRAIMWAIVG
jgi:hypothetical protein